MGVIMLKLDRRAEKVVEELKDHFGVQTKGQVFKKAIAVLDLLARFQKEGCAIMAKRDDVQKEIIIK